MPPTQFACHYVRLAATIPTGRKPPTSVVLDHGQRVLTGWHEPTRTFDMTAVTTGDYPAAMTLHRRLYTLLSATIHDAQVTYSAIERGGHTIIEMATILARREGDPTLAAVIRSELERIGPHGQIPESLAYLRQSVPLKVG